MIINSLGNTAPDQMFAWFAAGIEPALLASLFQRAAEVCMEKIQADEVASVPLVK